jgi:hypothetical protein
VICCAFFVYSPAYLKADSIFEWFWFVVVFVNFALGVSLGYVDDCGFLRCVSMVLGTAIEFVYSIINGLHGVAVFF